MRQSYEQHLKSCEQQLHRWSSNVLHIVALIAVAMLFLGADSFGVTNELLLQYTVFVVIAAGLFSFSCGFLYRRLRVGAPEQAEEEVDNAAAKLAIIGRLASGVAHDFNNSLTILINCIELMRSVDDSVTRQRLLTDMDSAVRGAQATVGELTSLMTEVDETECPTDPRAALRSVAANLRRFLPENIIVRDFLRGTPLVALGSGRLEQMVLDVCIRSRDAMPNGGELLLRCYKDPLEEQVVIEIEDTVDSEHLEQRYLVGVSRDHAAVHAAGGEIRTTILEGQGSRTTITLPAMGLTGDDKAVQIYAVEEGRRALLLDDNELVLTMLSGRLEEAGYTVATASTVTEAARRLRTEFFDALVCDAILPDGTPIEAIRSFRQQNLEGSVIVCSGYPKDDPLLTELQSECAHFLQKPFSTDDLVRHLRSAA